MAQYFTDFSEYTEGVQPFDWTKQVNPELSSWSISNGRLVGELVGPSYSGGYSISWDIIDAGSDPIEVYCKGSFSYSSFVGDMVFGVAINGYGAGIGYQRTLSLLRYFSSGATTGRTSDTSRTFAEGNVVCIRARVEGDVIQVKGWLEDEPEPPDWNFEYTESHVDNYVGIFLGQFSTGDKATYMAFGVGTNGDPAPVSPVPPRRHTLWAWGYNNNGQLGLGDTDSRDFPVQVGSSTDWVSIATAGWDAGDAHTLALKRDGTLWAWGGNEYGQLGLGDTTTRLVPTQVGTDTDWVAVAAGVAFSLAIKQDGTLWVWGCNVDGELGTGSWDEDPHPVPTQLGTDTDWVTIASGFWHSLGIKQDGTLWAWGTNWFGQIGLGPLGDWEAPYPPTQVGTDTDWAAVAAGDTHSLAIKQDGTLWAWGENWSGQLGLGSLGEWGDHYPPTQVGTDTDWAAVAAGDYHSLALKEDGTLWAWGENDLGQLGLIDVDLSVVPTQVGTDTDWLMIASGFYYALAIKQDGTLWAWGWSQHGELGLGLPDSDIAPVPTQVGADTDWVAVAPGYDHTLALRGVALPPSYEVETLESDASIVTYSTEALEADALVGIYTKTELAAGALWVWGRNSSGQLGLGDTTTRPTPTQVGTDTDWATITGGHEHTLALKEDGTLWAWGYNYSGQLGLGSADTIPHPVPTQVGTDTDWVTIAAGSSFTLALKEDGSLWAWGYNDYGQLGLGDSGSGTNRLVPTRVGTDTDWATIAASYAHTLALKEDGTLWAWGHNYFGQLGLGDTTTRPTPTQVGADTDWAAVAAGDYHSLALKEDGTLWAWGENYFGQLGLGDTTTRPTPTQVGTDTDWVTVIVGKFYTLALKEDGTLWVWGQNSSGQLGLGDTTNRLVPTQVGTDTDWVTIAAGGSFTLALKEDGSLWAWGYNDYGQLGLGDSGSGTNRLVPTRVGTDTDWAVIAAGNYHSLALFLVAPPSETETLDADTRIVIYSPITRLADASVSVGTVETVTADGSVTVFSSLSLLADASVAVYVPEALAVELSVGIYVHRLIEIDTAVDLYAPEILLADVLIDVFDYDVELVRADVSVAIVAPEILRADVSAVVYAREILGVETELTICGREQVGADVAAFTYRVERVAASITASTYVGETSLAEILVRTYEREWAYGDADSTIFSSEYILADKNVRLYCPVSFVADTNLWIRAANGQERYPEPFLHGSETLTYAPHFRYVVQLLMSDARAADQAREDAISRLPEPVLQFMESPPSAVLRQAGGTVDLLYELIQQIEDRLANDRRVVEDRAITFAQYREAIAKAEPADDDILLINAYELAHLKVDGDPAVLLYRQLKSLAEDFERFYGTLTTEARKLQGDARDLETAEAEMLEGWITLEERASELQGVIARADAVPDFGDEPSEFKERGKSAAKDLARLEQQRLTYYDTPSRQMFRVAEAEAMMLQAHLWTLHGALGIGERYVWENDFLEIAESLIDSASGAEEIAGKLELLARLLETANLRISNMLYDLTRSFASAMLQPVRQLLYSGLNEISENLLSASGAFDEIETIARMGRHSPSAEMIANLLLDALESYRRSLENLLLDLKRGLGQMDQSLQMEVKQVGEISQTRAAARILRKIASAIRQTSRKLKVDDRGEVRRFLETLAASNGWSA